MQSHKGGAAPLWEEDNVEKVAEMAKEHTIVLYKN